MCVRTASAGLIYTAVQPAALKARRQQADQEVAVLPEPTALSDRTEGCIDCGDGRPLAQTKTDSAEVSSPYCRLSALHWYSEHFIKLKQD